MTQLELGQLWRETEFDDVEEEESEEDWVDWEIVEISDEVVTIRVVEVGPAHSYWDPGGELRWNKMGMTGPRWSLVTKPLERKLWR